MLTLTTRRSVISLAVASVCSGALAQQPQQPQAADKAQAAAPEISTVMVTATRFSTSLLKTPLSVTAISQEDLRDKGVTNLIDLNNQMPNVQITEATSAGQPNVVIRGITGTTTSTEIGEGAVGFHVDGIFQPRPQAARALMFDLRQVEVLRGPQGTLFGRNSTAGSINVLPEKPDFAGNYGSLSAEVGDYHQRNTTLIQNIRVSDNLAFRIAANHKTRDSFYNQLQDFTAGPTGKNSAGVDFNYPAGVPLVDQRYNRKLDPSEYYGAVNQTAYRLGSLYKINKDINLGVTYEKYTNKSPGWMQTQDCAMAEGTRYACRLPQDTILVNVPGDARQDQYGVNARLNWKISNVTQLDFVAAHTNLERRQIQDGATMHPFPFNVNYVFRRPDPAKPGQWLSAYGAAGCSGNLCTYPVNDVENHVTDSSFRSNVAELQLKQSWDKVRYVAGLFSMHETNKNFSAGENLVGNTAFASPTFSNYFQQMHRTIDSRAIFGQADWDVMPSWTLTAGARHTRDKRADRDGLRYDGATGAAVQNAYYQGLGLSPDGYNLQLKAGDPGWRPHTGLDLTTGMGAWNIGEAAAAAPFGRPVSPLLPFEATWKKTTWRLGLKKDLDKNNMMYGSIATGYKAGGFNDIIDYCGGRPCANGPSPDLRFPVWNPENVINYEVGYKGRMLDNKLSLSVSVFKQEYKDLQQVVNVTGALRQDLTCTVATDATCDPVARTSLASISKTENVGRLSLPGAELEWSYRPWQGFTWSGFASYINPRLKDTTQLTDAYFCNVRNEPGRQPCPTAYTGNDPTLRGRRVYDGQDKRPANTPGRSFASTLSQRINLDNGWVLVPRVSGRWQDKIYFDLTNYEDPNFGKFQKAYARYDAGMRIGSPDDMVSFDLAVRNATNVRAKTSSGQGPTGTDGAVMVTYIEPRMVSVRMTVMY